MSPTDKALLEATQAFLKDRAALILATQASVQQLLIDALERINQILIAQPSDFTRWRLTQLKAEIEDTLVRASVATGSAVQSAIGQAWQLGEDAIDKPLLAIGIPLELQLPALDATLLASLRGFGTERLKDVAQEAAAKIGRELGLITLGAQTPFDGIKKISFVLQSESLQRATTIVRTSVSQAFAIAQQGRMEQSAKAFANSAVYEGVQLLKQWRRSGKIRSRFNHDLADGQAVPVDKPFKLTSAEGGFIFMMHPHDPKAPPEEVINCGCVSIPKISGWQMSQPGRKPFSELEQKANGQKAQIEQAIARRSLNPQQAQNPERLPNAAAASGILERLTGYALNELGRPEAASKARLMKAATGFDRSNAQELASQIATGVLAEPVQLLSTTAHGLRYRVDMPITGPQGSATLRTGWQIDHQSPDKIPRLITAYVVGKKPSKS